MSKIIFITGASSGLGLSHAIYLTARGYMVYGTSRYADQLDRAELKNRYLTDHTKFRYINKNKTQVKAGKIIVPKKIIENLETYLEIIQYITMDVTDEKSVRRAVDSIDNVDILINNAGSGYFGPVEELTLVQTQYQFDVNFLGMLRVLQSAIPKMRERKSGRIINTSSLGGISCIPFQAHYSATKAAVLRMTESLRLELKPFNIHVSSLASGTINTFFDANTAMLHHKDKEYKSTDIEDLLAAIPTPENSPYYNRAKIVWRSIIQNFLISPPPIIVSRKIERIIKTKRPKVHYTVGSRIQTLGLNFMKRVFPETWTTRVMAMFYGLWN